MSGPSVDTPKTRNAPPRAAAMVEALRGLGYTPATALADLIDNSITAEATRVEIDFHWAGPDSWIRIADDGRGMTDSELEKAMRIGDRNPLQAREAGDLGRFGLGLKTASFSQARRLTVSSLKAGENSCLRWDLDVLASDPKGDWSLLEGSHRGSEGRCSLYEGANRGTVVLWECLDRIVTRSFKEQDFLDLIDQVEAHLSMVFHRYLDRSGSGIEILLNRRKIKPWDPFLSSHPFSWHSPEVQIGIGSFRTCVQAYVLPHKDRLSDKEHLDAGGPEGWASQQGFYIYRGRRLLLAGSWLGLGRGRSWSKDESHRLARIRLDISNSADADWKIDIRKASAHPPVALREQLTRLAEDARDRARRVFLHRAQSNSSLGRSDDLAPVWVSQELASGRRYRIDRQHPAIVALTEDGGDLGERVEAMLRVLEETIPVQRIWLEAAETGEHAKGGFTAEAEESVKEVLTVLYRNLVVRKGMTPQDARAQLLKTEPFDLHPELVASLPEVISRKKPTP
jgi:hypothetical protein